MLWHGQYYIQIPIEHLLHKYCATFVQWQSCGLERQLIWDYFRISERTFGYLVLNLNLWSWKTPQLPNLKWYHLQKLWDLLCWSQTPQNQSVPAWGKYLASFFLSAFPPSPWHHSEMFFLHQSGDLKPFIYHLCSTNYQQQLVPFAINNVFSF